MRGPRQRDERSVERRQIRIGITGVLVAVALAVICGVVYLDPFGHRELVVSLESSGGLHTGDEVRIAGVTVGEVDAVTLHPDRVDVTLRVDDNLFIGDQTAADVRLLTAIGGHYLALRPAGSVALGANPIPRDRTTVPYTLADVIADSGEVVAKVDGVTISQTLEKVTAVLDGQPTAIGEIIADMRSLTTTVGDRGRDLDAAVALSEEYLGGLNAGRGKLVEMLRLIGFVGAKAYQVKAEGVETVRSIGALFAFVGKPVNAFTGTIEPPFAKVLGMLKRLQAQPARIDDLLAKLRAVVSDVGAALGLPGRTPGLDMSSVILDAPSLTLTPRPPGRRGLCVPSPDRRC
ncbi:MlaD family protein [Gordonia sp. ABSL1-1]|uniref:MlaD family protein n=1 Tax=Gordonia sp. ABSL1-1 TaxID=3053923 RepID=UPI0025741EBA|nr:MlaD family protein [Gordonia sp. ABSL1-1]MDL9938891.1 MlaD family protein [Gordonia sp. ABSL1-1]